MEGEAQGSKSRLFWLIGGSVAAGFIVAIGIGIVYAIPEWARRAAESLPTAQAPEKMDQATRERMKRRQAVMAIAPAPLPTALPLIERPGKDEYGYPRSYVDGPALRSLLFHEHFAELTHYIEQFQREFDAEPLKEEWPTRAVESFGSTEPELLPKLDAWVQATPASFAPYVARGTYWMEVAGARRGGKWASDTPSENFKKMGEAQLRAVADIEHALAISPKLMVAYRQLLSADFAASHRAATETRLKQALKLCPTCFAWRARYMGALEPRWGGSYAKMEAFAREAMSATNPKLKLLASYIDMDRTDVALASKDMDGALAFADRACALPYWEALGERALVHLERNELDLALTDINQAIDQRPDVPYLHFLRARIYHRKVAWEAAAQDLIDGARVKATDDWARWLLPQIVRGLQKEASKAEGRGDRDTAFRLLDLAIELSPFDREVVRERDAAVRGNVSGNPEELAVLEAKVKSAPDDFRVHQQLDFVLAEQRAYPRILSMWTEYLGRHPDDGQAYLERSGAYYNSGQRKEAVSDAAKACELGVNHGCAYAKRMGVTP